MKELLHSIMKIAHSRCARRFIKTKSGRSASLHLHFMREKVRMPGDYDVDVAQRDVLYLRL